MNTTRVTADGNVALAAPSGAIATATRAARTRAKRAIMPMAIARNPLNRRFRFMYILARSTTSSILRSCQYARNETAAMTPKKAVKPALAQNAALIAISLNPEGGGAG